MRLANTKNAANYRAYPGMGVTVSKNKLGLSPLNRATVDSLTGAFESPAYQSILKQLAVPVALLITLVGPICLLSDSLAIFLMLIVNNILGTLWGLLKFRRSESDSLSLLFRTELGIQDNYLPRSRLSNI